jgi:DNA-binding LacI/PurR family transcriptional regulator
LRACPEIDAVLAAFDLVASGAPDTLCTAGRKVPAEVAIVGFDDSAVVLASELVVREPSAGAPTGNR